MNDHHGTGHDSRSLEEFCHGCGDQAVTVLLTPVESRRDVLIYQTCRRRDDQAADCFCHAQVREPVQPQDGWADLVEVPANCLDVWKAFLKTQVLVAHLRWVAAGNVLVLVQASMAWTKLHSHC